MATQAHLDELRAAGEVILAAAQDVMIGAYGAGIENPDRDRLTGREMAMAVFVAARGDGVNRILLIEGLLQAIGECAAQQPGPNAEAILRAVRVGLADGQGFATTAFPQAGRA